MEAMKEALLGIWPLWVAVAVAAGGAWMGWCWRRQRRLQWESTQLRSELNALRAHQEEAAAHERSQKEALFNSMVEGILVLDAQQRVQLVNRALRTWFELNEDIRGKTAMEILRHHELRDMVNVVTGQGKAETIELEIPGPKPRVLQINACAFGNGQGARRGAVLVFHDVTRLKQLENLRKDFVANVSHELRTPLSLIAGCVETLIDGAQHDPVAADRFLRMIQKHTERLTFLLEDLLTLSQLESGRSLFNFQTVQLRGAVDRLLDDIRLRADARQATFSNRVPEALSVRADSQRLSQVLINLLDNAIKYGKPGGTVEVGAQGGEGRMVEVWVRDDGPGIPANALERIFERFYRVDRARSREQGGTGLGLAIVKHIVQSHGGKAWAASEFGKGATISFTLPMASDGNEPAGIRKG